MSGCLSVDPDDALIQRVPGNVVGQASVGDYPKIRYYPQDPDSVHALEKYSIAALKAAYAGQPTKGRAVDLNYLALSGGGGDGAYGAGFLKGWTASGTRPKFDVVTGISTGALIAPFAFLGPEYDDVVKQAYTSISTADVIDKRPLPALVGLTPSISSNDGMKNLIAQYITPDVIQAIGQEYKKGRMLLVGTTNLDAQRAVIWDIGRIATTGQPDAPDLIRRIILASASIPGVFPPVRMKVNLDGKSYDEFHVDGGVTRQVFLFPPNYDPRIVDNAMGWKAHRHAFIIRNGRIDPEYDAVDISLLPVANRSIATLIKTQGVGDLYRIHLVAQQYNMDYNVTYIPGSYTGVSKEMFDKNYMQSLFDYGYSRASHDYHWSKQPPGLERSAAN